MLRYRETNWKSKKGFRIRKYDLEIDTIQASNTLKEQQAKIQKISLVAFLEKEQKKILVNICRRLKRNNKDFYQNSNLHVTVFGFGPLREEEYKILQKKIQEFSKINSGRKLTVAFNAIRPGTMFSKNKTLIPVHGMSNGTVIAVGDIVKNQEFCKDSNQLTTFLLSNKKVKSILGPTFRRKFPTVWCTLGYYNKQEKFKIDAELEKIFSEYNCLKSKKGIVPISEISLVRSKYKNLRYPKLIERYRI